MKIQIGMQATGMQQTYLNTNIEYLNIIIYIADCVYIGIGQNVRR